MERSFANQAPNKESHLIHPTQELPGSALRTERILANVQRLIDNGIPFGAIAVLARNTLPYVCNIYRFYDGLGIDCRFLPFYQSSFDEQIAAHAISRDELILAFKAIFDEWLGSERATSVDPIDYFVDYAIDFIAGRTAQRYQKGTDESVFVVDPAGRTWGADEVYRDEYQYGDLSRESLSEVLNSPRRREAMERTGVRMQAHCGSCPYFGACPGFFVGDASPQQQELLAEAGCPVREVLDHIVARLARAGLTETIRRQAGHRQSTGAVVRM
jgi:uncharacterized protein